MKLIAAPSSPAFYEAAGRRANEPCCSGPAASERVLYSAREMFLLGQTVGKYQILANLGSGGFGTVFLARQEGRDQGSPPADRRLRGAPAGASPARGARPPEHRRDPDGRARRLRL